MTSHAAQIDATLAQAEGRLEYFEGEVTAEAWKHAHARAMKCRAFESTLQFGCELFDTIVEADCVLRGLMTDGALSVDPKQYEKVIRGLISWWLRPCEPLETNIREFEREFGQVEHAGEFRKRHAEALWMLKPAAQAFDDPKMVACRDKAIDELRSARD